jgi:diphosphomevalonate decarboxylase
MKIKNPTLRLGENDSQEGQITWRSPSNIAIVKYWGKYGIQLPRNPNISFTLNNAYTETVLTYETKEKKDDAISLEFYFEGKENEVFRLKQVKFLSTLLEIFPFLTQLHLKIESHNSFPHSAGIASSASSMSALALCLCSLENHLFHKDGGNIPVPDFESPSKSAIQNPSVFFKKASYLARLGSGSACRSVYPIMAQWGKMKGVKDSSNEYAIPFESEIHEIFKTYHDDILIVSKGEKSVSSRMGHGLMDNNPYAKPRYAQANSRMVTLLEALKAGDVETFGQIAEDEALTLHALMMTSSPSFTLLKPNTLKLIEILRGYRETSKVPVFFSLDAGPNLHLLYPHAFEKQVKDLIDNELKQYCDTGQVIFDTVGRGAISL